MTDKKTDVLVIGAGVGGIRAALDLAELGWSVALTERAPGPGGLVAGLDHQYPNDHCGMCRMLPMVGRDPAGQFCLKRGFLHERVMFLPQTEVVSVEGAPGRMSVVLNTTARGVDPDKCIVCGACTDACPETASDPFRAGLETRKAIAPPTPLQSADTPYIDWTACTKCGACLEVCPTDAISLDVETDDVNLETGAVIVAPGVDLYNPAGIDLYGEGRLENVVTSLQYERMISQSGPYGLPEDGGPVRPSDGKPAHKIAWVQCVGSRNVMIGADYCSNACCMFAVKEARLTKETWGDKTETAIFYMDIRTHGRDFQRYKDEAETEMGVRFVRSRVHSLEPADDPHTVNIRYLNKEGRMSTEGFDLVVLSTGRDSADGRLPEFSENDGVLVLDSTRNLTDLAGALVGAGDASARAAEMLTATGFKRKEPEPGVPADDFSSKRAKILVACHLPKEKMNGLAWVDLKNAFENNRRVEAAVRLENFEGTKWADVLGLAWVEASANRLLLLSHNPATATMKAREWAASSGIPASLVEIADVRPVFASPGKRMLDAYLWEAEVGLKKLLARETLSGGVYFSNASAVVVGGGPAGMSAALTLVGQGISVQLVDRSEALGGNLPRILSPEKRAETERMKTDVENHAGVTVHLGSAITAVSGGPGAFDVFIRNESGEISELNVGAVILATGGGPLDTDAYGLGTNDRIVRLWELEKRVSEQGENPEQLVMIQCAGCRREPHNYCSRICCLGSLEAAMRLMDLNPNLKVTVFYRDMMTFGESEKVYTKARQRGISFIAFDPANPPVVDASGEKPTVEGFDPVLGEAKKIEADWVSLATGVGANLNHDLADLFGLDVTEDGFYREADSKWRPVDGGREGVFVCGLAKGPARADEAVKQGRAAAMRALRLLTAASAKTNRGLALAHPARCTECETCVAVCPYGARYMDAVAGCAMTNPNMCQGCGACAAACPNNAVTMDDHESGMMDALEAALL